LAALDGWRLNNIDNVTLSATFLTVKIFFLKSRKAAWRLARAAR
jgi:hypothetical protein